MAQVSPGKGEGYKDVADMRRSEEEGEDCERAKRKGKVQSSGVSLSLFPQNVWYLRHLNCAY